MAPHPVPGGVLALDLSSTVGWAYGHIQQDRATSGRWKLKVDGELEGHRYMRLSNEMYRALSELRPSRLVIEAPLVLAAAGNGPRNEYSMNQQRGLRAIAWCEAARMDMTPVEFSADLVRSEILGKARFAKGTVKQHVLRWARDFGYRVGDDNEADALALWTYFVGQMRRGLAPLPRGSVPWLEART